MLKIRLQRIGKKKQAHYKLVVVERARKPQGKFLEDLGFYNPHTKELQAKKERVEHWRSKGAQLSATANNLLVGNGIIKGEKVKAWKPKKKKEEKKTVSAAPTAPAI